MTAGIINVLKPPGMTSHDVVGFIRKLTGIKRVGHAGTLDPAAAGVLPVFIGPATRLIEYAADEDKSYRVELTFGYSTDTGDDTGNVITQADERFSPSAARVIAVLQSFVGEIDQVPPMYSALKVGGKRLYELARDGIEVARSARRIVIKDIDLVSLKDNIALFDVTCSKGTYIRSLCLDIGERIGCPAVMSFLVRTRVGTFACEDAFAIEEIAADKEKVLLPLDYALGHMPKAILPVNQTIAFRQGQTVAFSDSAAIRLFRVYSENGDFVGIGERRSANDFLSPAKVL